jgi:hypothetical protein
MVGRMKAKVLLSPKKQFGMLMHASERDDSNGGNFCVHVTCKNVKYAPLGEGLVLRIKTPGSVSDRQTHALRMFIFIFPVPPRSPFPQLPAVVLRSAKAHRNRLHV